jgi:hypothetical protein
VLICVRHSVLGRLLRHSVRGMAQHGTCAVQHAVRGGRDVADTAVPMNGISAVQNGVSESGQRVHGMSARDVCMQYTTAQSGVTTTEVVISSKLCAAS